jgi:hypothetical protein
MEKDCIHSVLQSVFILSFLCGGYTFICNVSDIGNYCVIKKRIEIAEIKHTP